jgi:hypothetical protein
MNDRHRTSEIAQLHAAAKTGDKGMPEDEPKPLFGVLDPLERISEVLFGVIMALTFTCTLGVATADNIQVKTMLIGALGCNLAWGVIDAGVYLIARINMSGRKILMLRAMRAAADHDAARRILADALPPLLVSALSEAQVDEMRQSLQKIPHEASRPRLTSGDWLGALGVCLLCFLSTFPVAAPFIVFGDARTALRVSNVVAVFLLFCCGYAFGYRSGFSPWAAGLFMVVFGGAMVGVAIALGG